MNAPSTARHTSASIHFCVRTGNGTAFCCHNRRVAGPEHVALPLNCQHCGGPIEVACEVDDETGTQSVRFACPYCGTPREFEAPGRVLWVAMRQPGEGPETRH